MTPGDILDGLHSLGFTVTASGGDLLLQGPTRELTPRRRKLIAEHKSALLALVCAANAAPRWPREVLEALRACTVRFADDDEAYVSEEREAIAWADSSDPAADAALAGLLADFSAFGYDNKRADAGRQPDAGSDQHPLRKKG